MLILFDQQEQTPWRFSCPVKKVDLPTGDYSLEGFESVLCVERKSLPDLVQTVVKDWQRFARQLRRMAAMDVAYIVCDAPVTALMEHKYTGETTPQAVRGKLNKILLQFGVHTVFLDSREIAAAWVQNLFEQYLENRRGES